MDGNEKQEIIIVKRGGEGGDGHHGGAWKIAFADFMTAMMALFLVLWLINAANEETKKSVASYFNPVKLVDRNRSEKGLEDSAGSVELNTNNGEVNCSCDTEGENESNDKEATDKSKAALEEEAFFADPAETLEEIVTAHALMQEESLFNTELDQPSPQEAFDASNEPEFVDPFSPDYWAALESTAADQASTIDTPSETTEISDVAEAIDAPIPVDTPIPEERPTEETSELASDMVESDTQSQSIDTDTTASYQDDVPEPQSQVAIDQVEMDDTEEEMVPEEQMSPGEELAAQIDEELIRILDEIGLDADQITLVTNEESVLISLADNLNFSMFGIGSAVPSAELINAVGVIGGSLVGKPIKISIVGHTDGRPYSGGQYDNWRLSAARAHATLYMLERGGLSRDDVTSIAGVADRQLRNAEDSYAPENRRIDILVEFKSL